MIKFVLIGFLFLVFIVLWMLIEKGPTRFVKMITDLNSAHGWLNSLLVFSAATASNREAEFIDETLPEQQKLTRLLRALLIVGFLLSAVWILLFWKN